MKATRKVWTPGRGAGAGGWLAVALAATGCGGAVGPTTPADTPITPAEVIGTYELRTTPFYGPLVHERVP